MLAGFISCASFLDYGLQHFYIQVGLIKFSFSLSWKVSKNNYTLEGDLRERLLHMVENEEEHPSWRPPICVRYIGKILHFLLLSWILLHHVNNEQPCLRLIVSPSGQRLDKHSVHHEKQIVHMLRSVIVFSKIVDSVQICLGILCYLVKIKLRELEQKWWCNCNTVLQHWHSRIHTSVIG